MGQLIDQLLQDSTHTVSVKADDQTPHAQLVEALANSDIAIEFTQPNAAVQNIRTCLQAGIPIVTGTTGWQNQYSEVANEVLKQKGALIAASNFSIGMNIFFELNQRLAAAMSNQGEYKAQIAETHHTTKLDAPSGTAVTLAQQLIEQHQAYSSWQLGTSAPNGILPVEALRLPDVPGTHTVTFQSDIDTIEMTHTAHTRVGFAQGAIKAAEWLHGKQGIYTMRDVLGFS